MLFTLKFVRFFLCGQPYRFRDTSETSEMESFKGHLMRFLLPQMFFLLLLLSLVVVAVGAVVVVVVLVTVILIELAVVVVKS